VDLIAHTFSLALVVGALITIPIGVLMWNRRHVKGSPAATIALAASAVWMLSYYGELHSQTVAQAEFFANLESVGLSTIPAAWLVFVLQYARADHWLTRRNLILIGSVPVITVLMGFTNNWHHLIWVSTQLGQVGGLHRLSTVYGVGFWVFVVISNLEVGFATFLIIQLMARAHSFYRLQAAANLTAAIIPWAASLHDLLHVGPLPYFDLTPIAFGITSAIFAWNVIRWRMGDLLPIARGVILESMEDALLVLDASHRVADVNNVACAMIGQRSQDLLGEPLHDVWPELAEYVEDPTQKAAADGQFTTSSGRHFDVRVSPLRDFGGGLMGHVYALRDVTSRVTAEAALRASETRYALAAQGANDGLWDLDLDTSDWYFSPRARTLLGLESEAPYTGFDEAFARLHSDDLPLLKAEIETHLEGHSPHLEREFRVPQPNGGVRWILCRGLAVRGPEGKPHRIAGSLTDITDHKAAEGRLRHAALHDTLTGLANRALLMDRLDHAIQRSRRDPSKSFAVLFLDLDRFKLVNDSLGHLVGDLLLKEVAQRLSSTLREVDTVARLGGDEFVVILEGIENISGAKRAAERIHEALSEPFYLDRHEVYTSSSIGIALGTRPHTRPEEMLRDADLALYQAKSLGGGRYTLFDQRMHQRAVTQYELEVDLRRALDMEGMRLHYQPICSLASRQIVGFEALLRWQHPTRGLLQPADFLSIAEDTGLIIPIGDWVMATALRQLQAWKHQFPEFSNLSMSVNFSARQMVEGNLVERVQQALDAAQLDPELFHLEITESVIIEDGVLAAHRLSQLRNLGVRVDIDDFGTGYSSLSVLHHFPVDCLKVERSFVSRIEHGGRDAKIVQAVISLAHALQLDVIAEGIETEDQLIRLMGLGCAKGQGFLLGAPQSPEAIEALLTSSVPPRQLQTIDIP
jgi:diguanylate cyclase (GGDEF)-like protein/PAS domain S-box-containing protein